MKEIPRLTFYEALIDGLWIHKNDEGRSRRSEFWWCILFLSIVSTVVDILFFLLQDSTLIKNGYIETASVLANAYFAGKFAMLLRRRLNDTGKPRMFYVFILLECATVILAICYWARESEMTKILLIAIGIITAVSLTICLWLCTHDSEKRSNRYGKCPKYVDEFADCQIDFPNVY